VDVNATLSPTCSVTTASTRIRPSQAKRQSRDMAQPSAFQSAAILAGTLRALLQIRHDN
jgi:hypothetical protein